MILIDVRTKPEYDMEHIDGAVLHNVVDMMRGIFPDVDKNEEITIYCATGSRTMLAKNLMERAGFKKVADAGGIDNLR
jgi:phage shock protein E